MKSAYETKSVKSVRAIALLFAGLPAGKIVAEFSDAGVCTATVTCFTYGPLADMPFTSGRAGGYGYDKLTAAIHDAIARVDGKRAKWDDSASAWKYPAAPDSEWLNILGHVNDVRPAFERAGYTWFEIC